MAITMLDAYKSKIDLDHKITTLIQEYEGEYRELKVVGVIVDSVLTGPTGHEGKTVVVYTKVEMK